MAERYGARPEAWEQWIALGVGEDLLPAVANPNAPISPDSKMQGVGKTPSRYNQQRQVVGIGKWTSHVASDQDLKRWKAEADYSISVILRQMGAVDVDVGDPVKSAAIRDAITSFLGPCPVRYRENSGKLLIPFKRSFAMPKRVLPVAGGMIEILGDGQQFIAEGLHPSGSRYQWNGTALPEMPAPDEEKFEAFCAMLEMCFGEGPWKIAREKRDGIDTYTGAAGDDPVAAWLADNWTVHDTGDSGQLFIECPFAVSHSTDSGPTSTAYYPAGTGGYAQGHFVCLHAHCTGRSDSDYLDATGYSAGEFADLFHAPGDEAGGSGHVVPGAAPKVSAPQLVLVRDKSGRIEPTADNLVKILTRPDWVGRHLAFDTFKDELVWAPSSHACGEEQWRTFSDVDYVDVRIELERRGMKPMGHEMLRSAVSRAAVNRRIDTAQEWLGRLAWDGVERIADMPVLGWGWAASDYSRAVGAYVWTAMAGRVLSPGVQADMAPILVGAQGARKTSSIKAMVPDEDFYTSIPLDGHDNDTSRRLRGKLVGELEELRGLNSKAIEEIKAWITRTSEGWIPKYREFESRFKRRLIFFGSTNDEEFLNDPTGERRWLPGRCGTLDVEWIKANREQLWAEGAAKFMLDGVAWQDAERLAKDEHAEYKVTDSWEPTVLRWLKEPQINGVSPEEVGHVTTSDALSGAVNIPVQHQDRGKEMRMAKVFKHLGWERKRVAVGDKRIWAYAKEEK